MNFIALLEEGQDIEEVATRFTSMDAVVTSKLRLIGVICGYSLKHSVNELKISGIMSVDEDRKINISIMPPERHFSKLEYKEIAKALKLKATKFHFKGDISDLGNEIGIVIGELYENLNEEEIGDIVSGLRHGISLTNGTHG